MIQESEWLKLKQVWFAMGANRDLRHLQRHIQHNYRVKMPLEDLRIQANQRNWTAEAIEFDSKLNRKIDAITIDSLAKELAAERINGWRKIRSQAEEFSNCLSLMLPKVKASIEQAKVISLDDARKFMETMLKVREFMDAQEVPMMPVDEDAIGAINYSNPAELGRALINAADIREISITDLEGMKEPSYGGKT